jgi:hypothetical protein
MKVKYSIEFETENENVIKVLENLTDILRPIMLDCKAEFVMPTVSILENGGNSNE